jgi:DNA-binding Lrp family transcriptional regulator
MVVAIVLLACEAGRYHEVAAEAAKIEGVKRAFPCFGRWDAVAQIEVADLAKATEIALKINSLPGIRATETLIQAPVG